MSVGLVGHRSPKFANMKIRNAIGSRKLFLKVERRILAVLMFKQVLDSEDSTKFGGSSQNLYGSFPYLILVVSNSYLHQEKIDAKRRPVCGRRHGSRILEADG